VRDSLAAASHQPTIGHPLTIHQHATALLSPSYDTHSTRLHALAVCSDSLDRHISADSSTMHRAP